MEIWLETGAILSNCQKVITKEDFKKGRVFYELGAYQNYKEGIGWTDRQKSGFFKEIKDPLKMLEKDVRLDHLEYIVHHNFVYLEKTEELTTQLVVQNEALFPRELLEPHYHLYIQTTKNPTVPDFFTYLLKLNKQ
jgi:hypothetical protein